MRSREDIEKQIASFRYRTEHIEVDTEILLDIRDLLERLVKQSEEKNQEA